MSGFLLVCIFHNRWCLQSQSCNYNGLRQDNRTYTQIPPGHFPGKLGMAKTKFATPSWAIKQYTNSRHTADCFSSPGWNKGTCKKKNI